MGSAHLRVHRERYIPSQQTYFAAVRPADRADIVVCNDDLQQLAWESRTSRHQVRG